MVDIEPLSNILGTLLLSSILAPLIIRLCIRQKLVDFPGSAPHKTHLSAIPLAGGPILFFSITLFLLVFYRSLLFDHIGIYLALLIIFIFGMADDRYDLSPLIKLLGQSIAAGILIASGNHVQIFSSQILNIILTFLWMVGITNAFNLIDSMDGLALGVAILTIICFLLLSASTGQTDLIRLCTFVLGASLTCFYLNIPPARLFLGDSGSQLLGFFLAYLSMTYNPLGHSPYTSWFGPILSLGYPIFDTCLVVFSRLRRKQPVYRAGLDHTCHRMIKMGISTGRATFTIHFFVLILNFLAFVCLKLSDLIANIIFGLVILIGVYCIYLLEFKLQTIPSEHIN